MKIWGYKEKNKKKNKTKNKKQFSFDTSGWDLGDENAMGTYHFMNTMFQNNCQHKVGAFLLHAIMSNLIILIKAL